MKSYWIVERAHESVLEPREVPVPQPKAGEVVIRVHAAGLTRGELIVGSVVHGGAEKLGGSEAAGVVHAVGEGVGAFEVGDQVMGRARGAFAEYATLHEGHTMHKPERLSWEEAAAMPSGYITAYEAAVLYGRLQRGEWLLVAGASAGVGVSAIQIAQVLGARVIGTTTSTAKAERLKAIGCEAVLDARSPSFAREVRDITGGGANIALDLVGGSVFPQLVDALAYEGRLAIVGYVDGEYFSRIDLGRLHLERLQVFGISNAKLPVHRRFEAARGVVRDILPAVADGRLTPVVDRIFDFDELPAAKAYMESNAMVGKVIVKVGR